MNNISILAYSKEMLETLDLVSQLAKVNRPILLLGERGVGKELIAHRVHYSSPRWRNQLLKVNCSSFSDSLLESQLFGHEAGSFTGAKKTTPGLFEKANQGSLFLDELATMSLSAQEKVLRVIEYGEFQRLGSQDTLISDVRIIAATNQSITRMVNDGSFRADLLDRLSFAVVNIPPLRQRKADIVPLAEHFAMKMVSELKRRTFCGFNSQVVKDLLDYSWPGNVRELKNCIERAVFLSEENEMIQSVEFDPFKSHGTEVIESKINLRDTDTKKKTESFERPRVDFNSGFDELTEEFERTILTQALRESHYNQKQAAKLLKISYPKLRGLLKKYQISRKLSDLSLPFVS